MTTRSTYLLNWDYYKGVQQYFIQGGVIVESHNSSKSHKDNTIERALSPIPMDVKCIEKEYGFELFGRTKIAILYKLKKKV